MSWKVIEDAPGYVVNEAGIVKNRRTNRPIKQLLNRKEYGYWRVVLTDIEGKRRPFYIHRLLGIYFMSKPEGWDTSWEINHIDRNRNNNCISNLEWVPHDINMAHWHYKSSWETYNLLTDEWEDAFPEISANDLGNA